ncbi:MAG: hypothetical protein IJ641_04875, partial [Lachnospiraceae bacterium]|nr:hypothetical protein [Lachnospiraceae bacterium]
MKQKLPVIFAFISFLILGALIVVGIVSPGNKTEKSARLFASTAVADTLGDKKAADEAADFDEEVSDLTEDTADEENEEESTEAAEAESDDTGTVSKDVPQDAPVEEVREPLEKYREYL